MNLQNQIKEVEKEHLIPLLGRERSLKINSTNFGIKQVSLSSIASNGMMAAAFLDMARIWISVPLFLTWRETIELFRLRLQFMRLLSLVQGAVLF